jgi:hypothetical protein
MNRIEPSDDSWDAWYTFAEKSPREQRPNRCRQWLIAFSREGCFDVL